MAVNQNEVWPFNLLCRIFDQEELQLLKWNAPKELKAFLIYTVRDAYSEWEADIIVLHFMEQMPPEAIAEKMRRQKERVALNGKDEEILKLYYDLEFSLQDIAEGLKITDTQVHEGIVRALRKLRHPKYFDLIRYGMKTTVREMIRMESECGFQNGFHRGIEERWEDVNEETGEMNVPESLLVWLERMPVEELQLPIRIINCLHRNEVVTVAELVQLKDKEIMAMNGMGKAAIKDIRKKQSAYIKELLIELVTNEITEISTREVVNVLGEPV